MAAPRGGSVLVTSPGVRFVRVWRKPAAGGLAALTFAILGASTAAAMTSPAPMASGPGSAQAVPAAGTLKATLLTASSKHPPAGKHAITLRSMHPDALREAKRKADAAAALASTTPQPSAPAVSPAAALYNGLDQPGLSAADEGYGATPPDTTGAIGPTRYVEMVNQLVGVYDRNTLALISSQDLASFVGAPAGVSTSDPQVQWDAAANRWLYAEIGFATGNNMLVFGWSKTSDPSDLANGWCHYGVGTGSNLQDYPKLGHDAHFLVVGSNVYDDRSPSFPFVTANVWAIPKPAANDSTCNSPVTATFFADATHLLKNTDGTLAFTPVPANAADSVANDPIFGAHDATLTPQNKVMEWHMESHPNPVLVADGDITVGTFAIPPSVPQPGTTYLIDSLDGRLTQSVAHFDPTAGAEAVWTQQTIAGSGRSVVRWYEFLPATGSVYQSGVLQNSTDFYFNAAISPTSAGNEAAIFYNRGSSTLLSMIGAQTRTSSTALGQMDAGELSLGSSSAPNQESAFSTNCTKNPCRWGDYSGASPDPASPHVAWGSNQIDGPAFLGYAQWTTQNFAVSTVPPVPDFNLAVSPSSQSVAQGSGTSYTVNIAALNGFSGSVSFSVTGLPAGATGTFSPNPAPGTSSTLTVSSAASTPTGSYPLTITGTSGSLTHTATATLVVKIPTPDFSLSVSPASQSVIQGSGTTYAVTITQVAGFTGAVSLSVSGLPAGSTSGFNPNPASTSSTLSVTTAAGATPGSYSLTLTGTSGSLTHTAGATLAVTAPPPCASVSLSPASPTQPAGSTVSFSASASGCPNPQYEYWVQYLDKSWNMLRAFSSDPTWSFNSAGRAPGVYSVQVWANQAGDPTTTWEASGSSTVTLTGCTSAALAASPGSPQPPGAKVTFTASSSGCPNPVYEFWLQNPTGAWTMTQAFGAATWSWDTTGLATGAYTISVWADQQGADLSTWEASGQLSYSLAASTPPPCSSASLSPASATQPAGSMVSFTASASGCPNPLYEYWVQYLDGSWNMLRAFSSDPTWTWNSSGRAPGVYKVVVWANQAGDPTTTSEANASSTVTLSGGCTSAALTANLGSPQAPGTKITFTASSSGCPNPVYEFWLQDTTGAWTMKQAFGAGTWTWDTTGLPTGAYTIEVWANQQGSDPSTWQAFGTLKFSLASSAPPPCASVSLSPATATQLVASTVSFSASASGCPNPQYEYWVQYLDGSWNMLRAFSTDPTWTWNSSGRAPGVYTVVVWANQTGDPTTTSEANATSKVTLTGCTSATLSPSSGSVAAGAAVTFTASSSGCPNPIYEFWLQDTLGNWKVVQAFSTATMWVWNTAGLAKGTYNIYVWANQQGADTSASEAYGTSTFTVN